MVLSKTANSAVPAGALDQASGGVDPVPSHVYATGSVPPPTPAVLVKVNAPPVADALGVTDTLAKGLLMPPPLLAVTTHV